MSVMSQLEEVIEASDLFVSNTRHMSVHIPRAWDLMYQVIVGLKNVRTQTMGSHAVCFCIFVVG